MDVREYAAYPAGGEKPLDRIVSDGGMCGIFRTLGCIGDSMSSGEFEALDAEGNRSYHDMFEYSWGQFIARDAGLTARNFSRGGMTAKEYWETFAEANGFWDPDKLCQAYIVALGVNDLYGLQMPVGSVADIDREDPEKCGETFAGYLGRILLRLKAMQPEARFFLVTIPNDGTDDPRPRAHAELMRAMAAFFDHTRVIDLFAYAPVYDEAFRKKYFMYGHMNPMGYRLTAKMFESYIDWLIRTEPGEYERMGFVGR